MNLTTDIKPGWLNVIRRFQSESGKQNGFAIITMKVVVDSEGNPVFWTSPEACKLEPKRGAEKFLAQIITGMEV